MILLKQPSNNLALKACETHTESGGLEIVDSGDVLLGKEDIIRLYETCLRGHSAWV